MTSTTVPRPVIGVAALIWRDKQLLLGQRIVESACWQFPGGHLEGDETVTECAVREVREETGLEVDALRHLGFTDQTFTVGSKTYMTLLVSCEYTGGEPEVRETDKCACWRWFDYRQLPSPLFEPITLFLRQQTSVRSGGDLYDLHQASSAIPVVPSGVRR